MPLNCQLRGYECHPSLLHLSGDHRTFNAKEPRKKFVTLRKTGSENGNIVMNFPEFWLRRTIQGIELYFHNTDI